MSEAYLDVKQWGNNLGVRLPAAVARAAKLRVNQRVKITVVNDSVIITPVASNPPTLAERLAMFDPIRHCGEAMSAERW